MQKFMIINYKYKRIVLGLEKSLYQSIFKIIETHLINCYSINGDEIIYNCELTQNINDQCNQKIKDQTLYLDNHLIVRSASNVFKFNLDDQGKHEIFNSVPLIQDIYLYKQINRKSFLTHMFSDCRLRILLLKNLKIQNTIAPKFYLSSTTYLNHMVSTRSYQDVYYFFNIQMTKQIRKYSGFSKHVSDCLHINSNYIFVPVQKEINGQLQITNVKIYDICNLKLKGTIQTKNRKDKLCDFIFIKDFNILALYYANKFIDQYDCNTFEYQCSEKLNGDYKSQVKKDKENGLILFQMRDIYN